MPALTTIRSQAKAPATTLNHHASMSNTTKAILALALLSGACANTLSAASNYVSHATVFLGPVPASFSPFDMSSGSCGGTNVLASGSSPTQCSADGGATWGNASLITSD